MRLLAIETSTPESSVALVTESGAIECDPLPSGRTQTEQLMAAIDRLLRRCGVAVRELDGFAVTVGPGAFIGIRVGIATVKGLALATGKPVLPLSTLEALASRVWESGMKEPLPIVCPMLDARRGEVYAVRYRSAGSGELTPLGGERLVAVGDWLKELDGPTLFFGDGARMHRAALIERLGKSALFPIEDQIMPSAAAVARLAQRRWEKGGAVDPADVTAVYLRPAAAVPAASITARVGKAG